MKYRYIMRSATFPDENGKNKLFRSNYDYYIDDNNKNAINFYSNNKNFVDEVTMQKHCDLIRNMRRK